MKETLSERIGKELPLSDRLKTSGYFTRTRNESVPILCCVEGHSKIHKYLLHKNLTCHALMTRIRCRLSIRPYQGLIFMIEDQNQNQIMITGNMSIDEISTKYIHTDGFLYVNIAKENIFG